jgi:hypothetical protein
MISRKELVRNAQEDGLLVTERTVRYWQATGALPEARLIGGVAMYPDEALHLVRALAVTRNRVSTLFVCHSEYESDGTLVIRITPRKKDRKVYP